MPRLILIQGPQSGDFFKLGGENYLAWDNSKLVFSYRDDIEARQALIRGVGDAYEIVNLGRPGSIQVNSEQIGQAFLHHGDLIAISDSLMIFDSDESDAALDPGPAFALPAAPKDSGRITGFRPGAVEDSESLLSTVSIKRDEVDKAKIEYRQKSFQDHDAALKAIRDHRRIATLLKVTAKISSILDQTTLLNEILDLIFEIMPADRGSILLFEKQQRKLRTMASKSRRGGRDDKVKISKTIVKEVLRTKESILSTDAQADQRFSMGMSIVDQNIRSALCVPLVFKDQIYGIIHLDTTESVRAFNSEDCDLMTAIALQAALALENARLAKEMAEKERLKYELDLASSIQKQLLPKKLPKLNGIEVYGRMRPAKELGGDYFDFISPSDTELHVCIGDVSGKGVPAGLVMVMARSYFRPLSKAIRSPRQILAEANTLLHADTKKEMFMSALLLYWNDADGKFVWSGAGHEHLLIYRAAERRTEVIRSGGVALGLMKEADRLFLDHELLLAPGDAVVLYTDGVTEAKNAQGQFFAAHDLAPVTRLVDLYGHMSAKELLEAILWEVTNFMGGAEQADDITVVTIKRR